MVARAIEEELKASAREMPVIVLTGPRQSGKSTLVRARFPAHTYVNLELPPTRAFAADDPLGFLASLGERAVIDEVQRVPELMSYIQVAVDEDARPGRYVLTGSQNFQLLASISQSLAGRAAVLTLLPFTVGELVRGGYPPEPYEAYLFRGLYPRLYDQDLRAGPWLSSYVATYLERDLRSITNVQALGTFRQFMLVCAGRVGQLVNLSEIGSQVGVSYQTVRTWIGILETSYLAFQLRPYHNNFEKRLVKSPKLYFYDVGLVSNLLGIDSVASVAPHFARGGLFECFVITEVLKAFTNRGQRPTLYFWRAAGGREVDLLIEHPEGLVAVEIKSGRTINADYLTGLRYFQQVSGVPAERCFVVYGGEEEQRRTDATILGWRHLERLFAILWPVR